MVVRIAKPEDMLLEAQKLYLKDFHRVSSSKEMNAYYEKHADFSYAEELVKSGKPVVIVVVASGRGKEGDAFKKRFGDNANVYNFDISRKELGKDHEKNRAMAETMHLPVADKTADIVSMSHIPIPLSSVVRYVAGMNAEGIENAKIMMLEMLSNATDSIYKLNLLEAVRVLKDNGVIRFGVMQDRQTRKSLEKSIEGLPLKLEEFKIERHDEKLVPIWRNYGSDVDKPISAHAVLRKTRSDIGEIVALYEQLLYFSLEQVMRIEGRKEGKSLIEEVLEEMKKAKRIESGKSFKTQPGDVHSFDVGGRPPEPPWSPVF